MPITTTQSPGWTSASSAVEAGVEHICRHHRRLQGYPLGDAGGVGVDVPDQGVFRQKPVLGVGELLAGDEAVTVLVGPQLGGDGAPVWGYRGDYHNIPHLEIPHQLPYLHNPP